MQLYQESHDAVDISAAAEVLNFAYTGEKPLSIIIKIAIGSETAPLAGNHNYLVSSYLNGVLISPASNILVQDGQQQAIAQSRNLLLSPGDTLMTTVTGAAEDTAIPSVATVFDMTPAQATDLVGRGAIPVDHNYGGTDALAYKTSTGRGIADATIYAYLKSDYEAGRRSANYIIAESRTNVHGRWRAPMMLDPAKYKLVCFKTGQFGPDVKTITVE